MKNVFLIASIFICSYLAVFPKVDSLSNSKLNKLIVDETFLPLVSSADSAKSINSLVNDLDKIITDAQLSGTSYSIAIKSLSNNKTIYQKNADQAVTPASLTKLITSYLLLAKLGNNKTLKTKIFSDAILIGSRDTILEGNLYLRGTGDPLLSVSEIDSLALAISKMGIKVIRGNIYGDGSMFDGIYDRYKYSGDKDEVQHLPPISALTIERNRLLVTAYSNPSVGAITITCKPGGDAIQINNSVKYSSNSIYSFESNYALYNFNSSSYINDISSIYGGQDFAYYAPKKRRTTNNSIRASHSLNQDGHQIINISGSLARGQQKTFEFELKNPELAAAGSLKSSLEKYGIKVLGDAEECSTPPAVLAKKPIVELVRNISDVLEPLNKNSDNFIAEHIFKLNGSLYGFRKNNTHGSKFLFFNVLDSIGTNCPSCLVNDGSGLSRRNLLTANAVVSVLQNAKSNPINSIFTNSLAVAGVDGTLKNRMRGTLADANLKAKTGTLRNASGLAGYVKTLDGEQFAFAMIFNGNQVWKYKELENKIGVYLAEFFYYSREF